MITNLKVAKIDTCSLTFCLNNYWRNNFFVIDETFDRAQILIIMLSVFFDKDSVIAIAKELEDKPC